MKQNLETIASRAQAPPIKRRTLAQHRKPRFSHAATPCPVRNHLLSALILVLLLLAPPTRADPVTEMVDGRMIIETPSGQAAMPIGTTPDWDDPQPGVTRAVIMLHGLGRDAARSVEHLRAASDASRTPPAATLLIVPQFLADADMTALALPPSTLHWDALLWPGGAPALGPAPVSSFDVLDAILVRLADRARFPALRHVVLAGHSAGGQMAQRYAIVGRGDQRLRDAGIALRFVIANPSSWLWFGDDRPDPNPACPDFNRWRYGLAGVPPYVSQPMDNLEKRYLAHDAVYLIGERDRDPNQPSLDRSCGAMTQGPHRFARAMQFMFNLELRQPNQVYHRLFIIRDVGHEPARMFTSRCGLAALFDTTGCVGLP